jgi:hypothetical protein
MLRAKTTVIDIDKISEDMSKVAIAIRSFIIEFSDTCNKSRLISRVKKNKLFEPNLVPLIFQYLDMIPYDTHTETRQWIKEQKYIILNYGNDEAYHKYKQEVNPHVNIDEFLIMFDDCHSNISI